MQREHISWNPKRHIPPVSLLLWHKIVAIFSFVSDVDRISIFFTFIWSSEMLLLMMVIVI